MLSNVEAHLKMNSQKNTFFAAVQVTQMVWYTLWKNVCLSRQF